MYLHWIARLNWFEFKVNGSKHARQSEEEAKLEIELKS